MHDSRRLTMADTVTPRPVIAQLVATMRALAGAHPGFRPVHAKGLVCAGTFRGTREARGISRALHLQGQAIPTIVRFSNAHGDPEVHDGLANPGALPRFLSSHPAARAFLERLRQKPVPASYGQASYHGEHAFLFTAADGSGRYGRYHWRPEAGEAYLAPDEARQRSANFLREELESRLRNGPVAFRLL